MEELTKPTVLAVDDTPENLDVVKGILHEDYQVRVAKSGPLALKIAATQKPDLVLLDVMMPDMDGFEVCRQLKASDDTKDIPVIFLTAKDHTKDQTLGLEIGAVDYIAKPINSAVLKARVKTHLSLSQALKTLAEQNQELIEAARLKEDVDRMMQHDLKSPLNLVMVVPGVLMRNDSLSNTERDLLRGVEEAGHRMLEMINFSLDLFKIERGTYCVRPIPVNVCDVAGNVLSELGGLADGKQADVVCRLDGDLIDDFSVAMVWGEPLLVHGLLANLLKNAIEALPEGGAVAIDISTAGSDMVEVAMENDGEVPSSIRETFFDKLVTAGKSGGSGLGTYSAKLMTEVQNGTIALDCSRSGCTRITVNLPRDDDHG